MKKTKIIGTIGPMSEREVTLKEMIQNGLNCIRINMSHAFYEEVENRINLVRKINEELNTNVAVLIDTKGPEIRTGRFADGKTTLCKDKIIYINNKDIIGDSNEFSINYPNLLEDISVGDTILLNNGLVKLKVIEKENGRLKCACQNTGDVKDKRSVNLPGIKMSMPFLSKKDREDILFAIKMNADFLALSFVSTKEDILEVRSLLTENNNKHVSIISKIENGRAVDNIDEILEVSDGIMVARGDLGVEVPMEQLPIIQKKLVSKCHEAGKICIVATEMLASMEENPRPTRAEVSDVANAVLDGTDAIMLSGETATGEYPAETVEIMAKIAETVESELDHYDLMEKALETEKLDITGTIAYSVVDAANNLGVKAIVASTMSGYTAKKISRFRPACPILATSPKVDTIRSLALHFGVYGVLVPIFNSTDEIIENAKVAYTNIMSRELGDKIIITGGFPTDHAKDTNFMKIEEL